MQRTRGTRAVGAGEVEERPGPPAPSLNGSRTAIVVMWLLNARTLALENLDRPEEHRYVTLSHRWRRNADEEVTFQDMADLSRARLKPGFHKIQRTCAKALDKGVGYAWVDTCCIDKSSSAALSEALNSLFAWYKASSYCFAYLEDLVGETTSDPAVPPPDRSVRPVRDVTESEWFTRGWTLPELIAPEVVEFYDASWPSSSPPSRSAAACPGRPIASPAAPRTCPTASWASST
ncbi:hypothetical protein VTK73DRAFT_2240 [Phialemonium thermophilum]|uniref:Heterokaryon incompatibility domain-containing protein n=1 Tax=Phialemonium thermophilum TaxID=223376 RepID=A0ABR3VSF7_9PEZI